VDDLVAVALKYWPIVLVVLVWRLLFHVKRLRTELAGLLAILGIGMPPGLSSPPPWLKKLKERSKHEADHNPRQRNTQS